ncbi:MAG: isoprenyl transferase [Rhodothermaceae bacterium]|nr:isoprenyl transferase [Rhodothermaceae bacterium]
MVQPDSTSHIIELDESIDDSTKQEALKKAGPIPKHIAIIMDGNGRWAKQRGKMRVTGHYEGVESVRDITETCAQLGVECLTLYTFSTENWYRPVTEVNALMQLLLHTVRKERDTLMRNDIKLRIIGDVDQLPKSCMREFKECMDLTANNKRMVLNLALSYSGRWDIINAVKQVAQKVQQGELQPEEITDVVFRSHLSTDSHPDPDLLIRTGGEFRISNFLLWEIAYTEIYVTDEFWPNFRRDALYKAIKDFQRRDRRYGRVKG